MAKENVVHAHNRIFFSHKEQNYVIYSEMNTTGDNRTKWIKSAAEKQVSYAFFHFVDSGFYMSTQIHTHTDDKVNKH